MTDVLRDSLTLSWRPPAKDGGKPITGYTVEKKDLMFPGWLKLSDSASHVTSIKVDNLLVGHRYLFRVAAENSVGFSETLDLDEPVTAKSPFSKYTINYI